MNRKWITMELRDLSVIVSIEKLKTVGFGVYDIVFDFANEQQKLNYMERMEVSEGMPATMFELKNYRPKSRLREGGYYELNTVALEMCQHHFSRNEDSYLLYGSYDMSALEGDNMPELLSSHGKIDKDIYDNPEIEITQELPQNLLANIVGENLQVKVRNVGEANWNELLVGDKIAVLYDIGAPLHDSIGQVQNKLLGRRQSLCDSKPVLILSHWDTDHIHCLKAMTVTDMRDAFSAVVCVYKLRSLTAQNIHSDLIDALPGKVYCLPMIPKLGTSPGVRAVMRQGVVSLYQGENSSNKNYSGLQMIVTGRTRSCHYTGDCRLSQADDAYQAELLGGVMPDENILIASHHGADFDADFRNYSKNCEDVVVSVGPNSYGHPNPTMETYLKGICNTYWRTDQEGEFNSRL